MPLDTNVASAFAGIKSKWDGITADNGQGVQGEWPPEGDHDLYILDVSAVSNAKFKDGDKGEIPAMELAFKYQMLDKLPTATDPTERLEFTGARFTVPLDENRITTPGNQKQWEISKQRLKGHCEVILGRTISDPLAVLGEVSQKISTTKVAVKGRISYREGKVKAGAAPGTKAPTYKTEHLLESISR